MRSYNRRHKDDDGEKRSKPSKTSSKAADQRKKAKVQKNAPKSNVRVLSDDEEQNMDRPVRTIPRKTIPDVAGNATSKEPKHNQPAVAQKIQIKSSRKHPPPMLLTSPVEEPEEYAEIPSPVDDRLQFFRNVSVFPNTSPPPFSSPPQNNEPNAGGDDLGDIDQFHIKIGRQKHPFAKDIDYDEFENELDNIIIVEEDEMRAYRPTTGTKKQREWKPLSYPVELTKLIEEHGDIDIEVKVFKKV